MDKLCPLLNKACIEHQCRWYIHLLGTDPNTGTPKDEWGCAVEWLPILLVENAQKVRQTTATLDALRSEMREPIKLELTKAPIQGLLMEDGLK